MGGCHGPGQRARGRLVLRGDGRTSSRVVGTRRGRCWSKHSVLEAAQPLEDVGGVTGGRGRQLAVTRDATASAVEARLCAVTLQLLGAAEAARDLRLSPTATGLWLGGCWEGRAAFHGHSLQHVVVIDVDVVPVGTLGYSPNAAHGRSSGAPDADRAGHLT